jgi:hypothetical protein
MRRLLVFCLAVALGQCDDTAPDPLKRTPPGTGATVVWDLFARPLPEVPFPNDIATFADPTSRTGRRINISLFASTQFERNARSIVADMEGFGTFAPLWVRFNKPPGAAPLDPAIDLEDVRTRMQGDDYAFADDPIYVINLQTGVPAVVDVGAGAFPLVLKQPERYWPNDPHVASDTLLYENREEGAGISAYDPMLDTDFDGVLDHPNTLGPGGDHPGIDNLLTWYERETDSLILRPLIPLEEKTEYAVVITDRMHGSDGNPVRSPFPGVYHPLQRDAMVRLRDKLVQQDPKFKAYFGDIAGTGLDHVAFAWSFTTAPMVEDMLILRDGLYGKGPFARFATVFPAKAKAVRAAGTEQGDVQDQPPGWETSSPTCATRSKTPYIVKPNDDDIHQTFLLMYKEVFGYDAGDIKALNEANTNVSHVVVGTYESPFLQGDPHGQDPDAHFRVNFKTGEGDIHRDTPSFWLVIPKPTKTQKQPFPVVSFGHGVGGNATDGLAYAGNFGRNGVATVTINMPMHGFPNAADYIGIARGELTNRCLVPWVDALFLGRTHDYNGDGMTDPGWWWWTSHMVNDRDNVRQGMLDMMQFTRILRTWDGKTMSGQDYNGDGQEDLAGDFDGDGTPDVGGPNTPIYTSGESLGGIMSDIHGGIDHQVAGSAPMSGGGGLMHDVGMRSYGVTESLAQMLSPLIVSVPATDRGNNRDGARSNCARVSVAGKDNGPCGNNDSCGSNWVCTNGRCLDADVSSSDRSVRMLVEDGDDVPEMELACLKPSEDKNGMTVVLTNLISGERRCARTGIDGRFRVPIPATLGDRLEVDLYDTADAVTDFKSCGLKVDTPSRRIMTFEQKAPLYTKVVEGNAGCPTDACAQFMGNWFPVNSTLTAPQDGLGYERNTPTIRKFAGIAQMIFDPADPVNFAPYYFLKNLPDPNGVPTAPRALMNVNTVGDGFVSISTGLAFARAAGVVPFFPPSALDLYPEYKEYVTPQELYDTYSRKTPLRVLIETHMTEGIARLQRHPAGSSCGVNYRTDDPATCPNMPVVNYQTCLNTLFDVDWFSEGKQPYDQQHLTAPLRLARRTDTHITDAASLRKAWEPRIAGVPLATDDTSGWKADSRVLALTNIYVEPEGKHTWETGDACKIWDAGTYGDNLMGHFFASGGKDPYYLSHPSTHTCLEPRTCDLYK